MAVYRTEVFRPGSELAAANLSFVERLVKMSSGSSAASGSSSAGPPTSDERSVPSTRRRGAGLRRRTSCRTCTTGRSSWRSRRRIRASGPRAGPAPPEAATSNGCRIGFDAGASDRKVRRRRRRRGRLQRRGCLGSLEAARPGVPLPRDHASASSGRRAHAPARRHRRQRRRHLRNNRVMACLPLPGRPRDLLRDPDPDLFLTSRRSWRGVPSTWPTTARWRRWRGP